MSLDDGRISKFQRQIYDWLKELYPSFNIEMEKLIVSSNQRVDIWIEQLETVVECDGIQHDKPIGYFVKTAEQWKDMVYKDKQKEIALASSGIRLVRISHNHKLKCAKDLEVYMGSFKFPEVDTDESIFEDTKDKEFKSKAKSYRQERYKEYKEKNKDEIKRRRKEHYLRQKEYKNLKGKN